MKYKEVFAGIIILFLFVLGYLGYDFFQKEKLIIIYNQDNNSARPTFYDISIDQGSNPIKKNLTLINSGNNSYGTVITQNITFFKGFNDEVIIRNITLSGEIRYRIYNKTTEEFRYYISPSNIPVEISYLNRTGDIFIKTLGTSTIENSFSIKVDLSTLRKMAQNNDFTNAILVISYYPQLSLDVHMVDKNVKQTLSSSPVYHFYIDLDEAFFNYK